MARARLFKEDNPNWKGGVTIHTCEQCGEEYFNPNRKSKYCSLACRGKSQQNRILKICENCDKEFETNKCYEKRVTCCSNECSYDLRFKRSNRPIICKECSNEFYPKVIHKPWGRIRQKNLFCSVSCLTKWRKRSYIGKKNPMWIGGTVQYRGADWKKQSRNTMKRDNYTCQVCFCIPEKIHVHHIIPYRIKKNNSLSNLVCLCPSCHCTEENAFRRLNAPSLRIREIKKNI